MNKHDHKHDHKHNQHGKQGSHPPAKKPPHKDWRLWVVVGLMLAAMAAYVLTMDESIVPGRNVEEPETPAAP